MPSGRKSKDLRYKTMVAYCEIAEIDTVFNSETDHLTDEHFVKILMRLCNLFYMAVYETGK